MWTSIKLPLNSPRTISIGDIDGGKAWDRSAAQAVFQNALSNWRCAFLKLRIKVKITAESAGSFIPV
jgi:hypothetical protein